MDDLLLFTPSKETHMSKLEDLLKALLKNGLKISPKKCQLFNSSLQYMGNEIFIENKKVWLKPLSNRLEAIQKLQPPNTPKGCRSFAGVVNFLCMFCPELQKLLKPINDLTRKGRLFNWEKEQHDSFEEIKCRLINHQFYICQIKQEDFIYIQILANLQQVAHYTFNFISAGDCSSSYFGSKHQGSIIHTLENQEALYSLKF